DLVVGEDGDGAHASRVAGIDDDRAAHRVGRQRVSRWRLRLDPVVGAEVEAVHAAHTGGAGDAVTLDDRVDVRPGHLQARLRAALLPEREVRARERVVTLADLLDLQRRGGPRVGERNGK